MMPPNISPMTLGCFSFWKSQVTRRDTAMMTAIWVAPQVSASLFPPANLASLSGLSQLGVVVYMFLVGLGLNYKALKEQGQRAVLTSHEHAGPLGAF
jgi:Kef-type K+ transport system membrane component KefB